MFKFLDNSSRIYGYEIQHVQYENTCVENSFNLLWPDIFILTDSVAQSFKIARVNTRVDHCIVLSYSLDTLHQVLTYG
jgi:hypothetical protein